MKLLQVNAAGVQTQMAGLVEIPAIVKDVPDEAAIAMALIENISA